MSAAEPRQRGAFDADEAELQAIRSGVSSISSGVRDEVMSGEAIDVAGDVPTTVPHWELEQIGTEELAGAALEVSRLRKQLLLSGYPFSIDRSALRHVPSHNGFYEYCLATSLAASHPQKETQKLVRHFERVVLDLLKAFAGGDAIGVRFGWPSERDWDSAPKRLPQKLQWMKRSCKFDRDEWTFDPAEKLDAIRRRARDARIDVVVRRSHGDGRIGGLTIIGQCGCGRNDVDSSSRKHSELTSEWLKHFFGRASVPEPLRVFATSQHIVRNDDLYSKQSEANAIVFDRIRLCLLAQSHPTVIGLHKTTVANLTEIMIREFPGS